MKPIITLNVVCAFMIVLICISCATKPIPIAYKCPKIVLPADPPVYIRALNVNSSPDSVIKTWVATAEAYRGWNQTVRKQIENSK